MSSRLPAENSLHIAFYCNLMSWPKRSGGGVRQWVLTMANALIARGYRVDILSEAPARRFIDEPLLDARVRRVLLCGSLLACLRLRRYVRQHLGVRVVAALDHYNQRAAQLNRHFGDCVHIMLTQRENCSADAAWCKLGKYRRTVRAVRRDFRQADAVVAVSEGLAADLRNNFGVDPQRLHTIYNPAFRASFVDAASEQVTHPWLADKQGPVVITVGRLHHVKGFDDLLRAFGRLPAELGARLVILGEGKERPRLEALVEELQLSDRTILPDRQPSAAPWMACTDLLVLSSRREGLSAVLIVALALGLPWLPPAARVARRNSRAGALKPAGRGRRRRCAAQRRSPPRCAMKHRTAKALQARAAEFSLDRALDRYLALWREAPVPAP